MVLNDKYGPVSMFYGGLTVSEREDSVTAFVEGETKYFVAIQQVGGTGLTLNVSDLVVYFSNTFKYADRVQSDDRCHRIGQTKTVTYIDLIAADTVDKKILTALENKQNISDYVTDLLKEGVTHNLM
jgi:SNF2 family DNA or RNA helicase